MARYQISYGEFTGEYSAFATGIVLHNFTDALNDGESFTVTRVTDRAEVRVRILTPKGDLSPRTYTYHFDRPIPAGTVVEVPSPRWSDGPTFASVQPFEATGDAPVYETIIRVVE